MSAHLKNLLKDSDPAVAEIIERERARQNHGLELIASENFVSPAVLEAMGNVMTNKYAEGLPGKRYYGGCKHVDEVETLAIERAKELFGAKWANVQPHSGAQANMAVYYTFLKPGDTILGMDLAHGGHLTHGSPVNFSGRMFQVISYGVKRDTNLIDIDDVAQKAREHRPKLIMTGSSAYPRKWELALFREIADEIGAYLICDMSHFSGLVAGKVHPDVVPFAHAVTSTTHKTLRGPRGGVILSSQEGGELLLAGMPKPKSYWDALDSWVFPGVQGGPLMHVIAAKAVAFGEALTPAFREYAQAVINNAKVLADEFLAMGYKVVSGGTDTHLILLDLSPMGKTGKAAEKALEAADITVNKNMVPFDPQKPLVTSGVRIGSPAITSRGMGVAEMKKIVKLIDRVIQNLDSEEEISKVRAEVQELASGFPLYPQAFQY
ncbi:MAG: serine hydroxymethyltransferase [Calditrichaeota bacterium]|nr:serine hydroxymethyltransferase [Calditrichota bacterium]MCB9391138.1 serine hydroxymethyltransferase [Calditrichota bacterium]